MTDRERSVARLRKLIKTAHGENRDFVYLTVENAKVIVRLLEEHVREEGYHEQAVLFRDSAST